MNAKLVELYVKRGRLRERIGTQRVQLAHELAPLGNALRTVDRARTLMHLAGLWIAANPGKVALVGVAVAVWRPRIVLRATRYSFVVWRNWGRWRDWLNIGLRAL
jgi:hypothetical protein